MVEDEVASTNGRFQVHHRRYHTREPANERSENLYRTYDVGVQRGLEMKDLRYLKD